MRTVYIAHPIAGDVKENLTRIAQIVKLINMTDDKIVPIVPYYVNCIALDDTDPKQRERGMKNNAHILRSGIVKELWLFGDKISGGMRSEIEICKSMGIPVISQSKGTRTLKIR